MKRGLCFVFLSTIACIAACAGILAIVENEEEKREEKFWSQNSFFFKPTKCRDEREGEDCKILLTPGVGAALLFPQMGRVYAEGTLGTFSDRKVKLVIQHNKKGGKVKNVPLGYKVLACYCNQPECLLHSPNKPVWVQQDLVFRGLNFSKKKPE